MYIEKLTTNNGLQSNNIISSIEDSINYYVISDAGLDVVIKSGRSLSAWITYSGGFTCVAQDSTYLYLGTLDAGVKRISKVLLSGNSTSSLSDFLSTTSTPSIDSNTINCVDIDTNLLIATANGINYYNGSSLYTKTYSGGINFCVLSVAKLYYSTYGAGLYYKNGLPTANSWSATGVYSNPTFSISNNINCFVVITNGSSVDSNSNKIGLGTDNGIYIIDSDETSSLANATITHLDTLAGGLLNTTYLKTDNTYLYSRNNLENLATLMEDNFNDNSIDTTKWTVTSWNGTSVIEQNNRLELTGGGSWQTSGIIGSYGSDGTVYTEFKCRVSFSSPQCMIGIKNSLTYYSSGLNIQFWSGGVMYMYSTAQGLSSMTYDSTKIYNIRITYYNNILAAYLQSDEDATYNVEVPIYAWEGSGNSILYPCVNMYSGSMYVDNVIYTKGVITPYNGFNYIKLADNSVTTYLDI